MSSASPHEPDPPNRSGGSRRRQSLRCPSCGQRFFLDETRTPPFCSPRCQLVDLKHWLDESIGLPLEDPSDPDQP